MCENLLELSVKQLVIQSRLASSIFRGQTMCLVCEKRNVNAMLGILAFKKHY